MSLTLVFVLALLAIRPVIFHHDVDTEKRMLECEEFLRNEMAQMLEAIEGSRDTVEDPLLSALQQDWLFWSPAAATLVLLTCGCWLARRGKRASASCREQERSSIQKKGNKQQKKHNWLAKRRKCASASVSSLAVPTPSPVDTVKQNLPSKCKLLRELVGDLLDDCRVLSKRNFMPELHPATRTDSPSETWSIHENSINYRLLVILRPPRGHSFSLGPTEQLPASCSCIRVVLECMCSREQLLGQMSCFLHPTGKDRSLNLLDTLCTGDYLDVEKVACWVQMLVTSAWLLLPQSQHCQLMVLPSCQSCKFQLIGISGMQITMEMVFAVQQGSSGASLSLEKAAASTASSTAWLESSIRD